MSSAPIEGGAGPRWWRPARQAARWVVCVVASLACSDPPRALEPVPGSALDAAGSKRALIVTVGQYARGTGWDPISSSRDAPLIRSALERHGFHRRDIVELADRKATRAGIDDALRQLVDRAVPGDTVVFHYSGHGQQMTDDDLDELDGLDEALVPYDAPRQLTADYDGRRHLRDDDLGEFARALRAKVGADGSVLFLVDSCFSGTATRGSAPPRGSMRSLGPPQERAGPLPRGGDAGSGLVDASPSRGASGAGLDDARALAPFVVLAAERHDRLAEETKSSTGEYVGPLSWVVSGALARAGEATTYRDLAKSVRDETARRRIPNEPQAEGDLDHLLFGGGAVSQAPYHAVTAASVEEGWIVIDAGALIGVLPGSLVEVHAAGAREPTPDTRLASGEVVSAQPFHAEVALSGEIRPGADLAAGQVFVVERSFGALTVEVALEAAAGAEWAEGVVGALAEEAARDHAFIRLAESAGDEPSSSGPEVVVRETAGGIEVVASPSGDRLLGPLAAADPALAGRIVDRVGRFAQSRYLAKLDLQAPGLDVRFSLVPCELECSSSLQVCATEVCSCVAEGDPAGGLDAGGIHRFEKGDGFGIVIENRGPRPAHVSLLDLMPDGEVGLLFPLPNTSTADTLLAARTGYRVLEPGTSRLQAFRACPPFGTDVLKLFATTDPVDFGRIARRELGASRGPFDDLFAETLRGQRGARPTLPASSVSSYAISIVVEPGGGSGLDDATEVERGEP